MEFSDYQSLNAYILDFLSKPAEACPDMNMQQILHKAFTTYTRLQRKVAERSPVQKKTQSTVRKQSTGYTLFRESPCPIPLIIEPLSKRVTSLFGIDAAEASTSLSEIIYNCVTVGTPIWHCFGRAVIQISEDIVVKVGKDIDSDEIGTLRFLENNIPDIPAPRPLGMVAIGSLKFAFMTRIIGTALDKRWSDLSPTDKVNIRAALDSVLSCMRAFVLPPGTALGSPSGHLCKDVRRYDRISTTTIHNETEFNDFVFACSSSRISPNYIAWVRSLLKDNHRIVFTHGDLHPRNIIVVEEPDGSVRLSGIVDWEAGGFYPEYWEQLKALNTRATTDSSDWWENLPPSILGYDLDVVVDRLVERTAGL